MLNSDALSCESVQKMSNLGDTLVEGVKRSTAAGKDFLELFDLAVQWRLVGGKELINSARWYANFRKAGARGRAESTLWTILLKGIVIHDNGTFLKWNYKRSGIRTATCSPIVNVVAVQLVTV